MASYTEWDRLVGLFRKNSPNIAKAFDEAKKHSIRQDAELTALSAAISGGNDQPSGYSKVASPSGSDTNPGTLASPYLTPTKLVNSLLPGQTGVLRGGTYGDGLNQWHNFTANGTASARITLTAYPGELPVIRGLWGAESNYLTIKYIKFLMENTIASPNPCGITAAACAIYGLNTILEHCELTYTNIAAAGNGLYFGGGSNAIIRYNKIHDVGACYAYDHGIYVGQHTNVEIYGNWIWGDNNGWGIQLYPNCDNARIHHNVIDGCGSGFVIFEDTPGTCINNQIYNNVVMNSVPMTSQGGFNYPQAALQGSNAGATNSFTDNLSYNNTNGISANGNASIVQSGNTTADPQFVDAAARNYTPTAGSPVASWGLWNGQ